MGKSVPYLLREENVLSRSKFPRNPLCKMCFLQRVQTQVSHHFSNVTSSVVSTRAQAEFHTLLSKTDSVGLGCTAVASRSLNTASNDSHSERAQ